MLVPDKPIMDRRTYASPMSYVGSSRRIWTWTRGWGKANPLAASLAWSVLVITIPIAWTVVTAWYVVTIVFFWWFMFPFRLIRRSHRKQEQLQRQQLATMQAMMIQQQAALSQNAAALQGPSAPGLGGAPGSLPSGGSPEGPPELPPSP
jgi:Flp pilus assembly protein TadB